MIIDAHSHGFHGKYLDPIEAAGGDWTKERVAFTRKRAQLLPHYTDVTLRLEQLDRNNFNIQVVTPSWLLDANVFPGDLSAQIALARALNDNMARLMEDSKGRLLTAGCVPLARFEQDGRYEMERAINTLGLKAISVPSNIDGKPLDQPEFEPFWAAAAEMGFPVYIHPRNPIGQTDRSYEADYDLTHTFGWPFETALTLTRLVFSGIMERYPSLKIVSHHLGGGMIPFFWGRLNEIYGIENQQRKIGRVMSKPLYDYFSLFYYDTAVGGSVTALRCAYDTFGATRLVFATDAPNGPDGGEIRFVTYPDVVRSLGLSKSENKSIFEDNARKILNLF